MEKLGVSVSVTSGYHPEFNGQVEQVNQEIGRFLRTFSVDNQDDWPASFHGQSMPRIPSTSPLLISLHFTVCLASILPCSCGMPIPQIH